MHESCLWPSGGSPSHRSFSLEHHWHALLRLPRSLPVRIVTFRSSVRALPVLSMQVPAMGVLMPQQDTGLLRFWVNAGALVSLPSVHKV